MWNACGTLVELNSNVSKHQMLGPRACRHGYVVNGARRLGARSGSHLSRALLNSLDSARLWVWGCGWDTRSESRGIDSVRTPHAKTTPERRRWQRLTE